MDNQVIDRKASKKEIDPPPERIETAHLRQLPNFIIIGAQRGGTTSLYRYLTEHPSIGAAYRKEVHFFDRHFDKGMAWYLAHFPARGEFPIVGEASPFYLFHPAVPGRIHAAVPQARFIALLRNPIDRAYSQYHMKSRHDLETLSFEDALAQEGERLAACDDPVGPAWRHHSYLARSLYAEQLERWYALFPREQLLVIKSEDFYQEPLRILDETLQFLELPPAAPDQFKIYHLAEYPDMDPATRRRLTAYFAPHNQRLYDLLGRNLEWEDA